MSDAFEKLEKEPSPELIVTQLNINPGYNEELMKKCPSLSGYMRYVEKIRLYRTSYSLEKAVQMAVDECISEGILVNFLKENKAGVLAMSIFEYDKTLYSTYFFTFMILSKTEYITVHSFPACSNIFYNYS